MNDQRITSIRPSPSGLKYKPNNQNENSNERKRKKRDKSSDKTSDQGKIFDDYA